MSESLGVLVAFSAGLFSFLSPCVLPLFPSYLSFITGMSVDRLTNEVTAGARTRVLIQTSDGKEEWGTVGVDDNLIEASLQALVDSMEYALLRK